MPMLHDPRTCAEITERVQALRAESPRQWGRMSVDQMVWHVNQGLLNALGQLQCAPARVPVPFLVKPLVLNLPWPKGVRTMPEFVAVSEHDFVKERERCLRLVDDFTRRDLDARWDDHMGFGRMTGEDWSRLMYKHMDHHLRQFSA